MPAKTSVAFSPGEGGGRKYYAFLVRAWKPLTYLLDIYFTAPAREKYRPYIYGSYRYVDNFEEGSPRAALLEGFDRSQAKSRPVYRCRIWGIRKVPQQLSGLTRGQHAALCNRAKSRITARLAPCDGWLRCGVDHVDSMGRLIVRLYDAKRDELLNPALLNDDFAPVFDVYRGPSSPGRGAGAAHSAAPNFGVAGDSATPALPSADLRGPKASTGSSGHGGRSARVAWADP